MKDRVSKWLSTESVTLETTLPDNMDYDTVKQDEVLSRLLLKDDDTFMPDLIDLDTISRAAASMTYEDCSVIVFKDGGIRITKISHSALTELLLRREEWLEKNAA